MPPLFNCSEHSSVQKAKVSELHFLNFLLLTACLHASQSLFWKSMCSNLLPVGHRATYMHEYKKVTPVIPNTLAFKLALLLSKRAVTVKIEMPELLLHDT